MVLRLSPKMEREGVIRNTLWWYYFWKNAHGMERNEWKYGIIYNVAVF